MKEKVFKKRNRRVLTGILTLAMIMTSMPNSNMEVYAYEEGDKCKFCDHLTYEHIIMGHGEDEFVENCFRCEMEGIEIECKDKTWAECSTITDFELPVTLNGYNVTWPAGYSVYRTDGGLVTCPHYFVIFEADAGLFDRSVMQNVPEANLTAKTYDVCSKGCQVILSGGNVTHNNKYTLKIPSNAAASGAGFNEFEEALSITGANMADNKEIVITAEGSEFTSETVASRIKYEVAVADGNGGGKSIAENGLIVSAADANGGYSKTVGLIVDEASFDNADDGEYTTTIKWTAKVRTAAATN